LPVNGVLVTFVKPLVADAGATDPAGFFVQAGGTGPALFVAVDASTLPTAVGDLISFTVTSISRNGQVRVASTMSGFSRTSAGNPVSNLSQSITAVDFTIPTAIDGYESELVSLTGSVTGEFAYAGNGYQSAPMTTTGTNGGADGGAIKVRLPNALADSEGLAAGCTVQLTAVPLWRFATQAQPSPFAAGALAGSSCPAPTLVSATALSPTSVRARFNRPMNPVTISTGTLSIAGLTVSAVAGSGNQYTLTTSSQTSGSAYTLTASSSAVDVRGTPINSGMRTANFTGFAAPASSIVINEVDYDNNSDAGSDAAEFVELYNRGSSTESLTDRSVVFINGGTTGSGPTYRTVDVSPAVNLAPGEYLVIGSATFLATLPSTFKKVTTTGTTDLIQNGSPDAVAFIATSTNTIFDAVSYEGSTTWTSVVPNVVVQEGATSTTGLADVNDGNSSVCRIANGNDTNDNGVDFRVCSMPTPGATNVQ
jgi:hypothetical protein